MPEPTSTPADSFATELDILIRRHELHGDLLTIEIVGILELKKAAILQAALDEDDEDNNEIWMPEDED